MKKIILLIIIPLVSILPQTAGNSGMSFLKFGFGARNISMGDVGSVISNDVTALYYNPANLAGNEGSQVMFMHNEWIQDVTSEVVGVKSSIFGLPVALGLNTTSVSGIEIRQKAEVDPEGTFNANYFFGSLSTGFFIKENISFGVTAKYLYEGLYTDESTGWGVDFGLNYRTPYKGLTAAAVVKNLGSMDALRVESTKLPTEFKVGAAYSFDLNESDFGLIAAGEFQKYTLDDDSHFNFGGEVMYKNIIALRAGYQTGYESRNFTGGVGLIWGNLNFDYAFVPFSLGFGSANLFSLSFKF
jgi:hypothetical protein